MPAPSGGCPKNMVMGPCGGVRANGECELAAQPCAFPVPERWADPVPAVPLRSVPLILTDFTSEPYSAASHRSVAAVLAPVSDAVLVGDHQRHPDFPPALLASLLQDVGARPWVTLTCRDRNRVALEQELAALHHLDVDAVLCVTGDGRPRTRPGAAPVFDLDGPRLTALAAAAGIPAVVPGDADPMEAEFGIVAEWTAEVASQLGPDYAIPAACRGSAQPAALDWLLAGLDPAPGALLVDVGAGLGGPDAFAAAEAGIRPLLLEPEQAACWAAAGLFGLPVIQADATALPVADGRADAAWSPGVLCTLPGRDAQLAMLRELRRIVRPGGRIGLLVYVAARLPLDDPPEGNRFPAEDDLDALVRKAGLAVLGAANAHRMSAPPADWRNRIEAVDQEDRLLSFAPAAVTGARLLKGRAKGPFGRKDLDLRCCRLRH